jgi:hypothetical protein
MLPLLSDVECPMLSDVECPMLNVGVAVGHAARAESGDKKQKLCAG